MNEPLIIYGHHPVVEALEAGKPVEKVFFQEGIRGEMEKQIRHLTKACNVPLQVVPRERLNKMVRGTHQGVAALLSAVQYQSLDDLLPLWLEQSTAPLLMLLDGITDVRNFGAVCRSAECAGAQGVIVPQSGAAPANEEAMKASAGALARMTICRVRSIFSTVELLQQSGIQVVATALTDRSIPIFQADFRKPTALLMGSEGTGVHPKLLKMADVVAKIPQASAFDSFNVSVAAGIALYEVMRQRLIAAHPA